MGGTILDPHRRSGAETGNVQPPAKSILSAARNLARREGWDAVTMRRLADEIEYSANFAYSYFTGRDDILLALVRDGFTRLRDTMATASHGATTMGAMSSEPSPASGGGGAAGRARLS